MLKYYTSAQIVLIESAPGGIAESHTASARHTDGDPVYVSAKIDTSTNNLNITP